MTGYFQKILLGALSLVLPLNAPAQQPVSQPESKAKYHEFDFWLGEWNVYKYGTDTLVGISAIESVIDSLGILENYFSTQGKFQGKSLNTYNVQAGSWEQFWVDNSGTVLKLQGNLADGVMVLANKTDKLQNKITWTAEKSGSVRQTWSISQDDGETWQVVFDGLYVKKE